MRPTWDEYFMNLALQTAKRSTCPRAFVGAVLVKDKRIISTGYNGSPAGLPHCTEVGCQMRNLNSGKNQVEHCVRTVHAEQNAIIQAAIHGISTKGSILYVTHQPCHLCAKMLVNAGVEKIIYNATYKNEDAESVLKDAKIPMNQLEVNNDIESRN